MNLSKSQFIGWESVPLANLFKRDPGSIGLYIPVAGTDGTFKSSIARISSAAKSYAVRNNKRCLINTLLVLRTEQGEDLPRPSKMVQIVVTASDELSPQGERYTKANPER